MKLHAFLTSTLDGDEWSASRSYRFIPVGTVPSTHWLGGWVDHRANLNAKKKRQIFFLRVEPNPDFSVVQPIA
jgi:hypothetical protein